MAYATVTDLEEWLGDGWTRPNAQRLLDRASRDVDRAIQSAVYATDTNDLPTDPVILAALKEATLEQVAYNLEVGNTSGIIHAMQSGVPSGESAGAVGLSRVPSAGGSTDGLPWLGAQAGSILQQAGLLGQPPYTWVGLA
jgi:hypothetical protein